MLTGTLPPISTPETGLEVTAAPSIVIVAFEGYSRVAEIVVPVVPAGSTKI
jgi:hypothetical protein